MRYIVLADAVRLTTPLVNVSIFKDVDFIRNDTLKIRTGDL